MAINFGPTIGPVIRRGVLATSLALNQKKLDRYEPPKVENLEVWTLACHAVLKTVAAVRRWGFDSLRFRSLALVEHRLIPWLSGNSSCLTSRRSVVRVHPGSLARRRSPTEGGASLRTRTVLVRIQPPAFYCELPLGVRLVNQM